MLSFVNTEPHVFTAELPCYLGLHNIHKHSSFEQCQPLSTHDIMSDNVLSSIGTFECDYATYFEQCIQF